MRGLVLDFDGVLADSAPECFEVALGTYADLRPEHALGSRDRRELFEAFVTLMPLGNRAEDFGVALAALDAAASLPDQVAYDVFRDRIPQSWRDRFHRRFYERRAALAEADPERWCALNRPFPAFLGLLRRRREDVHLALATAKDRAAVLRLLEAWGARDLFDEALVFDKEVGVRKTAHLERARSRLGIDFGEITFVDDKVNHLVEVSPLGVRCGLAAWGYNGARERTEARSRGFLVFGLDDAEERLFGRDVAPGDPHERASGPTG